MKDLAIKNLRLDLVDIVKPYGVTGKELIPFDDELRALLNLSSKQREKELYKLAKKICIYYKKIKGAEMA